MFARLSIYANVDLDVADRVKTWMEAQEADPFAGLPGYRGSMTLVDRDNARVVGIGFYDSAGDAAEAEAAIAKLDHSALPEDLRHTADWRPEAVGLYEVVHRD
jgi:hypothetical protein